MDYPQEQVKPYRAAEPKRQQVEEMFNNIAPTYDRLNHTLSLGIDRRWRRRAISTLKPYAPQHMLDVAVGTGDFAIMACRMLKPQSLLGVDIADGMMAVGRQKVQAAGLQDTVSFAHEDCTHMTLASDSFDAVTVAFGIRNFDRLDLGLQEMRRVLKRGGRLVVLELSEPTHFPMKQLYRLYAHTVLPTAGRIVSKDSSAYTYLPQSIAACPQGQQMKEAMQRAGFGEVSFTPLTLGICTLYEAVK